MIAQLALYRAAVAPLYPDRPVRAFLVWLGAAEVIEIPSTTLDDALARFVNEF
jgi:ATP-dependent helicase/nuclease subunit A